MSYVEGKLSYAHRERDDGFWATEIIDADGETVFVAAWYPVKTETGYTTNREENARRLVACWNACEGYSTEELERIAVDPGGMRTYSHAVVSGISQERDELLAALRYGSTAKIEAILSKYNPAKKDE